MVKESIIVIDNKLELDSIENQYPNLKNTPLILLSPSFSLQQLESFKSRGYIWFDELISKTDAKQACDSINHFLWHWFLDEKGQDLSVINGCSLGSAFASSNSILFNTVFRYQIGLRKLIKRHHVVYYSSEIEGLCIDAITYLQSSVGFAVCQVDTIYRDEPITFGRRNLKLDISGRKRDLEPLFRKEDWKERAATMYVRYVQKTYKHEKRVLFMPAGKMEKYCEDIKKHGCPKGFRWIFPLSGVKDLLTKDVRSPLFYCFSSYEEDFSKEVRKTVDRLKKNINKNRSSIYSSLLIKAMERYSFTYFYGALRYYNNSKLMLRTLKPDLIICSADSYENFILSAHAAKSLGIQTALIPHGLYGWGFAEYKAGQYQLFDHFLAFGNVDRDNYIDSGVEKKYIHVTSFPYFERFLNEKYTKSNKYRRVLLLSPDVSPSVIESIGMVYNYYKDLVNIISGLNIEVVGIKARHKFVFNKLSSDDDYSIKINGKHIPLLSGYSSFPAAVKSADFVIGPVSTACIESGLLGKDYYTYSHEEFHKFTPSICSAFYDYVNVSFNMNQLRENILKKQPYKEGCSVNDLIDLSGVKTKEDLYEKFESGIQEILDDIERTNPAKIDPEFVS